MKVKIESEVTQLCPTLSDPMDCSPPGSSVHGIFQARVLEWGAIAFSAVLVPFVKKTIFSLLNCFGTFVEKSIDNKYNGLSLDSQPSTTDLPLYQ